MKLGVNYPAGPFEWLTAWSSSAVVVLLDALDDYYRGERYRVSPWLRRHARRQAMKFAEFYPGQVIEAGPYPIAENEIIEFAERLRPAVVSHRRRGRGGRAASTA